MKINQLLRIIGKDGKSDLRSFKKANTETKREKLHFERALNKAISLGLVIKRNNSLKLTKEALEYLETLKDTKENKKTSIKPKLKIEVNNAKVDAEIIAKAYNIPIEFPAKCLKEAKLLPNSMENVSLEKGRIDLREIKTVTIDGADSKDFDDAISIEKLENGYKIGVHIADVSYFVPEGSSLDREARKRGNSVYLIDTVYPMFPHELSNGICSLNENVTRFTMTVFITIDKSGNIIESTFHKSAIKSSRRLTYDYAQDILDGIEKDEDWLTELLKNANNIKEILLKKRIDNGSIEFNLNEVQVILDNNGNPKDFFVSDRKETHKIIEELMLLANCEVAKKLSDIKGAIYRVHDSPDSEKLETFTRIAYNRGYKVIKDENGNIDFHSFIQSIEGKPDKKLLLTLLLRSMKQAIYDVNNIGHFGLGFKYYTHFTSPIRRYTDLLTHRLLKMSLEGTNKLKSSALKMYENSASWCSKTERIAVDAERDLDKVKAARFMKDKVGNEYEGIISGVTKFGFFVEIMERGIEGLIRYADLDGHYYYDEKEHSAYNENKKIIYTLGDKVNITVMRVNVEELFIDFLPSSNGSYDPKIKQNNNKTKKDSKKTPRYDKKEKYRKNNDKERKTNKKRTKK